MKRRTPTPRSGSSAERREAVVAAFSSQAEWCRALGSPLYGAVFDVAAADVRGGGVVWDLCRDDAEEPVASALALRLAAAVHRLALRGSAPELAASYPSCGGTADEEHVGAVFLRVAGEHVAVLRDEIRRGVQTNEVDRCAALLGGFVRAARTTGLPLRCFEIGASAGLNLRWDRYRYECGSWTWGPADAPLRFEDNFAAEPAIDARVVEVVERAGCDVAPIDPASSEGVVRLTSFVWPDQSHRIERLRAACDVASRTPVELVATGALDWLQSGRLAPRAGGTTVVVQCVMAQYLGEQRASVQGAIEALGDAATIDAPFAHLTFEPLGATFEIALRVWPHEPERRVLGRASPHGRNVEWFDVEPHA